MKSHYFSLLREIIENSSGISELGKLSNHQLRWFLKLASSNRVLFILCKKVKQLGYGKLGIKTREIIEEIIKKGEEINKNYSAILKKVKAEFAEDKISFLIVKTDRKVDYILSDIDILVKEEDFNKAKELLAGIACDNNILEKEGRWHYRFDKKVEIDIHKTGMDWYSDKFVDTAYIWNNIEHHQFLGDIYPFPSQQNEWIFNALNIIYEKFTLTYLDLLFFKQNENIDYLEITKIAKVHNWDTGLQTFLCFLNKIKKQSADNLDRTELKLPQMFSYANFMKIFISRLFSFHKNYRISLFYLLYFIFCKIRFIYSRRTKIPFYGNWFNFNLFQN